MKECGTGFPGGKMTKIFILSLPRCGTQSTYKFISQNSNMESHTLKDLSPEKFLRKNIDYVSDKTIEQIDLQNGIFWSAPYCSIYKKLKYQYPDAKFLLGNRPAQDWANSYQRLMWHYGIDPISMASLEKYDENIRAKFRNNTITEQDLINIFVAHRIDVLKEFQNANNFLDFDLYGDNTHNQIAKFLDLKKFSKFPHIDNTSFSLVWYNKITSP